MKKVSTAAVKQIRNISEQKLTIGFDLGDRSSWYCVLDEGGAIVLEQRVGTTPKAMKEVFGGMPRCRIALETGTHSPWVSRLLSEVGHEVIVAHARNVRLIGESRKKEGRSAGCTNLGAAGPDRSQVVMSGEALQRPGASGSDRDPGTSRAGASANGAGEHGPWTGQVLWGAAAWVQRAQHESGKSRRAKSGTANRTRAVAGGNRVAE